MRKLLLPLVAAAALAAATAPGAFALRMPTTGPRIGLFAPPRFELLVDGRDVPAAHDLEYDPNAQSVSEFDLSNFRFGLPAGTHTFEGRWYLDGVLSLDLTATITFS